MTTGAVWLLLDIVFTVHCIMTPNGGWLSYYVKYGTATDSPYYILILMGTCVMINIQHLSGSRNNKDRASNEIYLVQQLHRDR